MLIIFDCDGVLVDSEPIAARVLKRFLEDLNYPIVVDETSHDRFLGFTLGKVRLALEEESGQPLPEDFEDELRRRDGIAFETELMAIPGVAATVTGLSVPRCVASSGPQAKIRNSLTLTGLLDLFEPHLFSAHDEGVANGKPAPDLFLYAAERMATRAADCVVIEDSRAGVEAGVAAGMRVLGFTGGSHCRAGHDRVLLESGATRVFDDMRELMNIL